MSNKNEAKLDLIEQIIKHHPSSKVGQAGGWCHYTGGMKDSGDWNYKNLIFARIDVLQTLLTDLHEENKPQPPRIYTSEEEVLKSIHVDLGNGNFTNTLERQQQSEFAAAQERKFFEGI